MTDKISNINGPINGASVQKTSRSSTGPSSSNNAAGTESASLASTEQVNISSAQNLEKIRESLAAEPIVDRQKVETVKQALQDGVYQINSENIADKLIEFEQLLK